MSHLSTQFSAVQNQTDLERAIVALLTPTFAGIAGVRQGWQPFQQNTPTNPVVFFSLVSAVMTGTPSRSDAWDADTQKMVHIEAQQMEVMYQINALGKRSQTETDIPTSYDLVRMACRRLQSDAGIAELRSKGISIFKITDIRNPSFLNDKEQFTQNSSADFDVSYTEVIITPMETINSVVETKLIPI